MEEDDKIQHVGISREALVSDGDGYNLVGEEAGSSDSFSGPSSTHGGNADAAIISTVVEDDQFEQVSLKDHEKNEDGSGKSADDIERSSGGQVEASGTPQGKYINYFEDSPVTEDHTSSSPGNVGQVDLSRKTSFSTGSDYGESGFSPVDSPQKFKPRATVPNVSPELLHLIDSAIMGKSECLEKLKNIVQGKERFGDEEDIDDVAFLVVDSLLATMGGVESFEDDEDNNPPSVMLNSRAAIVSGELIPWLPCDGDSSTVMSPRTRMVRGLLAILGACTRNRAMCSTAGLLGVLLRSAERIFVHEVNPKEQTKREGAPLCHCIQHLAGHSLGVTDLHRWFQVVTRTLTTPWAPRLMFALEKAVGGKESRGPACTFEFDGESSGLLGPGESRWPFSTGYAFATWIYIESFADTLNTATAAAAIAAAAAATSGKTSAVSAAAAASALAGEGTAHMPRLFSFLSADNQGVEAYFHAQFLVVESGGGRGKKASLHFTHAFKPQRWYFIGLEHTCKQGLLGKAESELRLYIDGSLYESRPFEFTRISKPLAFCCLGTNPPPTMAGLQRRRRQCPLFAEMGPVYIFKEPIGPEKMARLAARGGDFLPSFGSGAGLPWLATSDYVKSLAEESSMLDAEIAGCIHLLYHPRLLSGRFCPDASPSGAAGMLRRPAEVLGQVHVASRMRPVEALWALAYGGPMSLLPLAVSNMKKDSLEPEQGNLPLSLATTALAAPIFRIIAMAIQHPGNNEELSRGRGPEILSRMLNYLLQTLSSLDARNHDGVGDEELVAAVVSLCQAQKHNHALKVQLFSTLLLDLKIWSLCNYGLQKKLLSSLADMVFTESSVMRDANAIQVLLDGCRRCYWIVREKDSVSTFSLNGKNRPIGAVNALVEELLVVIELLVVAAPASLAVDDMRCLLGFMVDCPQPNQVTRVLHLIYRLVVQPNATRAKTFADAFLSCGGIETLLVLLQREAMAGDFESVPIAGNNDDNPPPHGIDTEMARKSDVNDGVKDEKRSSVEEEVPAPGPHTGQSTAEGRTIEVSNNLTVGSSGMPIKRMESASENLFAQNVGGINFSISADNARNNVYNIDKSDDIMVGIIKLLGTLVVSGYLKLGSQASPDATSSLLGTGMHDSGSSMFDDKVSLLLFALQKGFQAAPKRLMTSRVYLALLGASINATSTDDGLNLYDSGHQFEHLELLLVLLRSLPYASRALQSQVLQDLLFLACSHLENRNYITQMEEWPDWILEVLISNYERGADRDSTSTTLGDIEDLVHNFLIIMLEHSMRQKDGWKVANSSMNPLQDDLALPSLYHLLEELVQKSSRMISTNDIEATIHCAEWLSMVGGSSTGDQRIRREESLPIFKRRLLGSLLDFSARELQVQTQVIAAAAAGVAALSPTNAKAEADNAAQLSVSLVENAIVILMLVEDHLRMQSKLRCALQSSIGTVSKPSSVSPVNNLHNVSTVTAGEFKDAAGSNLSSPGNSASLPLDVLTSMADGNGRVSALVMERMTAAAAVEPYESVSCAFVSYGSFAADLAEGWKYRSQLWYGVNLPLKEDVFGGGGSGWESWNTALEKDANGNWIELPLIKKSVTMLQALLLDESGLGGGLGIGGGSGTGMGGMAALYQLLDSDQPFLCMLRMVLLSMREEDSGEDNILISSLNYDDLTPEVSYRQAVSPSSLDNSSRMSMRPSRSALLWSVLSPVLNMPISESKRQRVLVASSVLYSEIWHAVDRSRNPIRKKYLEAIVPAFVAVMRRWRPLLAGIHELATPDGPNPLVVDDRALAADSLPVEAALGMISPGWAAAFASPPAAMALAMIAAGASGGEAPSRASTSQLKRDNTSIERRMTRLQTFSGFQKPAGAPNKPSTPKDKAASKAAALVAARDLERNAKIGSGRGLSAVAMATSAQRRNITDMERVKRWNASEAMGTAWMECLQPVDTKAVYGKDFNALSYRFIAVLVASFALARNIQRSEIDRRTQVAIVSMHRLTTGNRAWRKLIHYLIEMRCLFGPSADHLCNPERIFWRLDFMESSSRMRMCLRRSYRGSDHFGAAANNEEHIRTEQNQQGVINPSNASVLTAEAISVGAITEDDEHSDCYNLGNKEFEGEQHAEKQYRLSGETESPMLSSDSRDTHVSCNQGMTEDPSAVAPGYVPSEFDERIILELPSSMVRPLKIVHGTFQITTKRINFIAEKAEGRTEGDHLDCNLEIKDQLKNYCWMMTSLHQIYSRRYLLRRSALELFLLDRSNFFFDFGSSENRKNAYRAIVQARPPHLNNIYLATQRPDQLLKRTQLMERWAGREISNFEYLMQLNTLAGRSYNDITQYPVFPWILSDYTSEELDLSNPDSYRDLSKPVGALNPERLEKFQERYSSFDDPVIPKFHYGSHYSSAGTVLYYLVRLEPFTTLSIQLQGGNFDHADRMFFDISATWNGVIEDMSDVKELVPELFYLPETLTNANSIDFGVTQHGEKLDTVKLPPWAKSPVDFVHKHRMALESEHVSAHLHEWIDLIFGYKQRGKEAIGANNVFFYVTYEGTVDIDKLADPVQQRAIQDQIAYFGQTPSQLLTTPHIKRMPLADVLHLQTIFRNPKELRPYTVPLAERCNLPASSIRASSDAVVIVDVHAPAAHIAQHKWQPNTPDGQGAPFLFQHGKSLVNSTGGTFMRMFKGPSTSGNDEWQYPQALAFATTSIRSSAIVAITRDKEVITGGHADNSIRLLSPDGAKALEAAIAHCAPVTCLSLSSDSSYLVTGSRDSTVILWRIHQGVNSSSILESSSSPGTPTSTNSNALGAILADKSRKCRIEGPIHVLRGHVREITCCCVNSDLGIIASCSHSSDVLLHTVRKGRLIRRLVGVEAHEICVSPDGVVLTWNQSLRTLNTFNLNGIPISKAQLPFPRSISCMEISFDGNTVLVGVNSSSENDCSSDEDSLKPNGSGEIKRLDVPSPSICFVGLHELKVFHTLELQEGREISAMALNEDNTNLLVSTLDRQLIIFTDPGLSLKVVDQMLKLGWEGDGLSPLIK